MHFYVKELLNKKQYQQRSKEWYEKRYNILSASNIAPILDSNPYMSKLDLLNQKCKPFNLDNNISNPATEWGIKYEPVAIKIYESMKNDNVNEVGLFIHDKHKWLGASPDGLCDSGKLVEIKCVWRRKITDDIPLYYWMQVQIQLEVCNLEECDLFQCKFVEYKNRTDYRNDKTALDKGVINGVYWKLEKYSLHTIKRDREWFEEAQPLLKNFWDDVIYYRKNGYKNLKTYSYSNDNISKKRKQLEDIDPTPLKRGRYLNEDWSKWINASNTKNYMMKDPLLDWLNMYHDDNHYNKFNKDVNNNFNDYIISKDKEFKNAIIQNLHKRFPTSIISIAQSDEKFSSNKYQETINAMSNGTPIILKGILHNRVNTTYGMPDIILRMDYLKKIFKNVSAVVDQDVKKSHIGYKYCIVSIKYMSLTMKNDYIVNTNNIASYKSEVVINNEALKPILGYVPNCAFIIGKKYKDDKIYGTFEKIGVIDISSYDSDIVTRTHDAITWLKDLQKYGKDWDIYNPHRWELYPNMSNIFDYPWHQLKMDISEKIGEITLLWNCGVRERNLAHMNNIYKWEDLNSNILNFNGKKGKILDNIIDVNLSNDKNNVIIGNYKKIKKDKIQFFVDFETVNTSYSNFNDIVNYRPNKTHKIDDSSMIYMIGVGWENPKNGKWEFKYFVTDRLNHKCEKSILLEWIKYMDDIKKQFRLRKNVKVYHWSKAEVIESKKAFLRHNIKNISINWYDLLDYFKNNSIAVKGVYNYGLKSIANSLYKHKKIKTKWSDSSLDGALAMLAAWNCEEKCLNNEGKLLTDFPEMVEIVKYNEIDCKALWDILKLFSY